MKQTKTILSMLCAAALFAACSSTDELEPVVQAGQQTESEAVGFDVYTRGTTRAGYVGDIDATTFQATGFGVYAYVTSAASADDAKWATKGASAKPNFMANQYVTYNTSGWTYSPVKYWPNQANIKTAGVDNLGGGTATNAGDNIDYVSFFAYAPYVESGNVQYTVATAATAALTTPGEATTLKDDFLYDGIVSLPGADEAGDPKITYVVPANPAYGVDLMYGVAARAYTTKETTGQIGQAVVAGKPFLNMTKEVVDDKIAYRFQHALTKLGINVDAYFDEVRDVSHEKDVDANTRIVIESISIQGTADSDPQKLYSYGVLNLNNDVANTPRWEDQNAEVTNLTSRIATGLSLVPIETISSGLTVATASKEQGAKYFALQPLGVTKTKKSLFGNDISGNGNATLMLIPGADNADPSEVSVTIKYHVITRDANLANGVSDITNEITNSLGSIALKAGSQTIINMHLGMTTVKIDAQVADWDGTNTQEVDLPANVAVASVSGASIDKYGKISMTSAMANLQNGGSIALTIGDVFFTDVDGNVLPVNAGYISGNYNNAARTVKMWYGGVAQEISQAKMEDSDITSVAATIDSDDLVESTKLKTEGGTVTITVTMGDASMPFNCDDWTLSATGGDFTIVSTDNASKTWTVTVNETTESSDQTITFKVTNKGTGGINASATAITQKGTGV